MDLEFLITNQTITRTDTYIPRADSIGYLYAHFTFSSDWNDIPQKTAIFSNDTVAHKVLLDVNNKCAVPSDLLVSGKFEVSAYAENSVPKRYTANTSTVWVWASGYQAETEEELEEAPSIYAQILDMYQDILDAVNAIPTTPPQTMRKLISYTVGAGTSVGSLVWTEDDEGNDLALEEAEIRIYIPANSIAVGQNGYIYARINGQSGNSDYQSDSAPAFSMAILGSYRSTWGNIFTNLKKIGTHLKILSLYDRWDGVAYTNGRYLSGANFSVTTITSIYLAINGLTYFPTGTIVEIHGRTA